jgi:hypothetical protein
MKESRAQFQKIISANFNEVKRTIGKIDQFGIKESEMMDAELLYKKEKDSLLQTLFSQFQQEIDSIIID